MPSLPSLPLSALQHLLFCERRCALIHIERVWAENRFTAEGRVLHDKAHDGPGDFQESEAGGFELKDKPRKTVLTAWQERKQQEIRHPFLDEKTTVGMLVHLQARLLARHLRNDPDAYPPFLAR